jgi:hypothetical protein
LTGQATVFLSTLAYAKYHLTLAFRTLLITATGMMKSTYSHTAVMAMVILNIEMCLISEGYLPFHPFHTRINPFPNLVT